MNAAMVPIFSEDTMKWIEFNKLCYEQSLNVTNVAFQVWMLNLQQLMTLQNEYYQQTSNS